MVHPRGEKPPRRGLRALGRAALIGLLVLAGLPLVVWLAVLGHLDDPRILAIAQKQLEAATGLEARAGRLELSWLEGLVLEDVRLAPPAGFRRSPVEIPRLELRYDPAALWRDSFEVTEIRLRGPRIRIEHDGRRTNLAALVAQVRAAGESEREAQAAPPSGGGLGLSLARVVVEDLALEVELPGLGLRLAGVGLAGELERPPGGPLGFRVKASLPRPEGVNLRLPGVGLEAAAGLELEACLREGNLTAEGALGLTSEALAGRVARADFQAVLELDPLQLALTSLRLELAGRQVLEGSGELRDLLGRGAFRLGLARVELLAPGRAGLLDLLPDLPLEGRASLTDLELQGHLDGSPPRAQADLQLTGVSVGTSAARLFGLHGKLRLGFAPGAEAGGEVRARGGLRAGRFAAGPWRVEDPRAELDATAGWGRDPEGLALLRPRLSWTGGASRAAGPGLELEALELELGVSGASWGVGAAGLRAPAAQVRLQLGARRTRAGEVLAGPLRLGGTFELGGVRFSGAGPPRVGRLEARLEASAPWLRQGGLVADAPGLALDLRAGDLLAQGERPGAVELRAHAGPVRREGLGAARVALSAACDLASLRPRELALRLAARLEGLELARAEGAALVPPAPLTFEGELGLSLPDRRLRLERAGLGLGDLVSLRLRGELDGREGEFRIELASDAHRAERLLAALPEDLRARLPALAGEIELDGSLRGRLPRGPLEVRALPFEGEATILHRALEVFLPAEGLRVTGISGPVRVWLGGQGQPPLRASLELSAAGLSLRSPALRAQGLELALASAWDGEALMSDGRGAIARMEAPELWSGSLADVGFGAATLLSELKELRLTQLDVRLGSAGLSLSGEGQVVRPAGAASLAELRLDARTRIELVAPEPVLLPGGLSLRGKAGAELQVRSVQPGVLRADGKLLFEGLDATAGALSIQDARGSLPVSQFLALRPTPGLLVGRPASSGAPRAAEGGSRSSAYEQALRPLKGEERSFSIRELGLLDLRFSELGGNLELAGGTLGLSGFRFRFLGGDFLSDLSVSLAPPGTRRLRLDAEMSGVELARLPQLATLAVGGRSDVSGNLRLNVDLAQDEVGAAFNLTQIGRSTLQALLLAMDSGGHNPGLVSLRGYLESYDVSPRQVSLNVRHGLLGMRVELEMGLAARAAARLVRGFQDDAFEISHLPVGDFLAKYLQALGLQAGVGRPQAVQDEAAEP
jgi:hypothetical protein